MRVDYQNPLLSEQVALLAIRKIITDQKQGARITITDRVSRKDYTIVSVKIEHEGRETSICHGQVLSQSNPLIDQLKAEMIALCMCASELGITIEFSGSPSTLKEIDVTEVPQHFKFDRDFIIACGSLPNLKSKMESLGMDIAPLEAHVKYLRSRGEKISIKKAAIFLLGERSTAVYVKGELPQANIQKKPVKKQAEIPVSARDSHEVQEVLSRLSEAGITDQTLKEKGSKYSFLIQFAQYATDEDIEQLIHSV